MKESKFSLKFPYDKEKYGVVIYFFEEMVSYQRNFKRNLEYMSQDISFSTEATGYYFASSCDEEDIENGDYFEEGVFFFLNEDDVIIDYEQFYTSLKLACQIYLEDYPEDKDFVEERLSMIKKRYQL
ncbi:ribonuclease toxin immunity protein CdiI [Anaeromicropila populeti]|uniref:CDI immunity protein domain-containing protein n=1 Tax=Anaeromicropila populeti TaxID=37658 RepID=A0A1I6M3U2_9FIRM|nr:ribonuclease toxin immunity protein CdiI [Anaeromicropila populeti]SFS10356.1 hypothetical protein SAMN05661086_03775 [Anaeromicropila populeti]